ncbi:MAG TPA: HNH endonuclease signature motif containing protein [Candidatus Binataceae bacterium]|nr:HNH endonuclease signature motif containing protein [Candidatus Binataceae bacterium]
MELEQFFKDFQDYLAPRLDTYEQAIYLYLFRHTRLVGIEEAVFGFKSARRRMACGIGEKGKPMSESTAREKLQSLQNKGCIRLLDTHRDGRKIQLRLPSEIPGVVTADQPDAPPDLETQDFFEIEENRARILEREGHQCFYCLRKLNGQNYVIEHVISRPAGNNTYRNVVAACRQCNNGKGSFEAAEWLRTLYRDGFLSESDFKDRTSHLERLRAGELKAPEVAA